MKIVTAPEEHIKKVGIDVYCFLAGGIMNCKPWQDEVIKHLEKSGRLDRLVLFNPRRKDFPFGNPDESRRQIEWEFRYLQRMDIFSMYFCAGISDQPICMYELGRNLCRFRMRHFDSVIISIENGYQRADDVDIQTELALGRPGVSLFNATPERHAELILDAYTQHIRKFG